MIKGQMIFVDEVESLGWTETYYLNGNDLSKGLDDMATLATVRAQALSVRRSIGWVRTSSNVPNLPVIPPPPPRQRQACLRRVDIPGSYKAATGEPDTAWQAAKIRYSSTDCLVFRTFLMRGLDDSLWSNGDDKIAKAFFKQFLPKWVAALAALPCYILHKNRVGPAINPVVIAKAEYEGMTRRATGRPLFLPRGRRLAA